jgi:molecular chaperone IbpA|tara:strand:+ start:22 stop:450 length:429 start_codon:yes stop_codon:yes gene_type:complete
MTNKFLLDLNKPIFSNSFIGFDTLFDNLYRMQNVDRATGYPPYNMTKDDTVYKLQMAVAGISKEDLDVVREKNTLTIRGSAKDDTRDETTIHKGIAQRSFKRKFNLADDIEIKDAKLKDGMLTIKMERIIPEENKPVSIKIK